MPGGKKPITDASPTQDATVKQFLESSAGEVLEAERVSAAVSGSESTAVSEPTAVSESVLVSASGSASTSRATETRPQMLIYDGDCRFCVRRARWFQRRARRENLAVAYQDLEPDELDGTGAVARHSLKPGSLDGSRWTAILRPQGNCQEPPSHRWHLENSRENDVTAPNQLGSQGRLQSHRQQSPQTLTLTTPAYAVLGCFSQFGWVASPNPADRIIRFRQGI